MIQGRHREILGNIRLFIPYGLTPAIFVFLSDKLTILIAMILPDLEHENATAFSVG